MKTSEIRKWLDATLTIQDVPDYGAAFNGLQVDNNGEVKKIAAAVDASEATIARCVQEECDFLLVHHGLFWDGNPRITGRRYRRTKLLLEHNIAVYSAHLPLDVHPEFGNNSVMAQTLGIKLRGMFGQYKGMPLGVWGDLEIRREALAARLDDLLGVRVKLIPGGPEIIKRVGVITGGAGSMIADAVAAELDAFVTGEGTHPTYFDAMEDGINVYYAGHYATETFGVRALAARTAEEFGMTWRFIDLPTGL